jgi:hypothetical protein
MRKRFKKISRRVNPLNEESIKSPKLENKIEYAYKLCF